MTAFLIYAIRWAVVLTMLYSLYGLFMKRETLHGVNRVVLLLVLVASMVLPLCQVKTSEPNVVTEGRELLERQIIAASTTGFFAAEQAESTPQQCEDDANVVVFALMAIYIIGVVVAWARYLWSLASLLLLIRRSERVAADGLPRGVTVLTHPSVTTPCSWMRWMLLPPADVQARPIILHELSHIRLHHSWDMLLCELTCRMLWCVPFAWMLRQDLRDVHEYQADRRVLRSGIKDEEYQLLLIRKATGTGLQTVVNAFNQSPIKRRFKMMYKKPSRRWVALKAAYLLPLGALSLVAFARPQAITEIEKTVEKEVTHYAGVMQSLVEPKVADKAAAPAEALAPQPVTADDGIIRLDNDVPTDANLVKADLNENPVAAVAAAPELTAERTVVVLDSVMQAVGARKIADGTYIGHFQPSLNNDTVRLAQVEFLDKESKKTATKVFQHNAADPYAYNLTLQAGTRKGEIGHYIRYLTPVKATARNYDRPKYDTKLLPTDEVLLNPQHFSDMHPIAIERTKQDTRVYLYIRITSPNYQEPGFLKNGEGNIFSNWVICDNLTNDVYMFRSTDDSYLRQVGADAEKQIGTYQVCLVFPPLGKKVKEVWIGFKEAKWHTVFNLNDVPRKGQVITN